VSYNVLCHYIEEQEDTGRPAASRVPLPQQQQAEQAVKYIGQVQFFVKVLPPAGCAGQPLRLAVTHLYKLETVAGCAGMLYHAPTYLAHPACPYYAVDMGIDEHEASAMQDKHVMACSGTGAFFMPYSNMSASGSTSGSEE
jgi:predicted metal-binding protein